MTDIELVHNLQKKLFQHLKSKDYFISGTMVQKTYKKSGTVNNLEPVNLFTEIWVTEKNTQNNTLISYNGYYGYGKKDSSDYYKQNFDKRGDFLEVDEEKFDEMLNRFDNVAAGNKDFIAFNNFGYINDSFYIEEMKLNKQLQKFFVGRNEYSQQLNIEKLKNDYWLSEPSKTDNLIIHMPKILEYLRVSDKNDWLTLIKNGLYSSNPSQNDYSKTINYLKQHLQENELLEIILNDLMYKKTTGKNKFLRKELEILIPEDSPYFNKIAKKFVFLSESKKQNNEKIGNLLGKEFATNVEDKVIYKKIDIIKVKKNVSMMGWSIYTYEKALLEVFNSFKDYYNIKSIIVTPMKRSNKLQEVTLVHNDNNLTNEVFVNVCNHFVKILLENKNQENYLNHTNTNKNDDFKNNVKAIVSKILLEHTIEYKSEQQEQGQIKNKKNKI